MSGRINGRQGFVIIDEAAGFPRNIASVRAARGFVPLYRTGTRCPGCNGSSWHVGRRVAECARCATALPIGPGTI